MTDQALTVVLPEVETLARPTSGSLIGARNAVQKLDSVKASFVQAKNEGWSAERLAEAIEAPLQAHVEGSKEDVRQAALYLAAEFLQFGDALLLVSRETGQAIARITEADLYEPSPVPRESGGMAKPLTRLRPELEGFLFEYVHEHNREKQLYHDLVVRTKQTGFLAQEGDRKLNLATRQGRRSIEAELRAKGTDLLQAATGTLSALLQHFTLGSGEGTPSLTGFLSTQVRTQLPDPLAVNYKYDHFAHQQTGLSHGWLRELALSLGAEAHQQKSPEPVSYSELTAVQGVSLWVCDPQLAPMLMGAGVVVVTVPEVKTFGLMGSPVGTLDVDATSLVIEGRELFNRWDVMGRLSYSLYLDWSRVVALNVESLPVPTVRAEVC